MRVIDLENINNAMRNETQFVLRCEEVYHDKISAAAASILSTRQERPVVALTGPSGSGKTTLLNIIGALDHGIEIMTGEAGNCATMRLQN